ncbi:YhcN/YlaJ family sporulation lipoprotein [Risungbinella massiliensis]|uniref:YhcN/YlaJ family sporulation lipoprotein n=1 Tax=Risungbinella massiliensis TaxID=1329796 RepID=UPI0005CC6C03|nr:YhcN/YlaJ family sporulation lipoprotein [Risungbinella massiliensis]
MKRKLIIIPALTLGIASMLVACQPENKAPANESAPAPNQNIPHTQRVKQTAPEPNVNRSPQAIADHLSKLATQFPQVRDATVLSIGNYTVVGLDVDPTLDRGRVGTVKYAVAQALKEDPNGSNALVTADMDLYQRLREANEDLQQGRPLAGILHELADIVGRIIPQPSREVKPNEQTPSELDQERINQTPRAKGSQP